MLKYINNKLYDFYSILKDRASFVSESIEFTDWNNVFSLLVLRKNAKYTKYDFCSYTLLLFLWHIIIVPFVVLLFPYLGKKEFLRNILLFLLLFFIFLILFGVEGIVFYAILLFVHIFYISIAFFQYDIFYDDSLRSKEEK